MKKIICRFRNQEDLDLFSNGMLDKDVKEVVFEDYAIKEIKRKPAKTKKAEHHKIEEYMKEWKEMPEFSNDFKIDEYAKIEFVLDEKSEDLEWLSELFQQNITPQTKSVWFPKLEQGEHRNIRVLGGRQARYPIFVVSRGRYNEYRFSTSNWLSRMCQPHYVVVEEQEYELYLNSKINESPYCTILKMDMSYKDKYDTCKDIYPCPTKETGPGAARNFCMDYAKFTLGVKKCWTCDCNSENFDRLFYGRKILSHSPEVFACHEDFVERYSNVGMSGLNYSKFCVGQTVYPPYTLNTRIYSYTLHNLEIYPLCLQRGTYNEDSISSLDILDAGYCTIQQNVYTGAKCTTSARKGGNTQIFYDVDEERTRPKSEMLAAVWPKYAKVVYKFHRVHHEIDYSGFTQKLKLKPEYEGKLEDRVEENGTWIVRIPRELCLTEFDNREYLEEHYPKGCPEEITPENNPYKL